MRFLIKAIIMGLILTPLVVFIKLPISVAIIFGGVVVSASEIVKRID